MLKRIVIGLVLACCLAGVVNAQPSSFDPTSPKQVAALHRCLASSDKTITPFRPVPNSDPRFDGQCWKYNTQSNYEDSAECSFASRVECDNCLSAEQTCVDGCYSTCGNDDNTNGSCFEECGDACRQQRNYCWSSNHC